MEWCLAAMCRPARMIWAVGRERGFSALEWCLVALCRPAGVIWAVGREGIFCFGVVFSRTERL